MIDYRTAGYIIYRKFLASVDLWSRQAIFLLPVGRRLFDEPLERLGRRLGNFHWTEAKTVFFSSGGVLYLLLDWSFLNFFFSGKWKTGPDKLTLVFHASVL